ncbi:hypothetical protein KsCSTR_14080 [Candidatus Kuenenia stuttgartiensis]|uniref:Uncharacterized protein n=1 Tax=Kuenenia stuttgartiensis TaxID=174633 RepID=Q1Q175_KUEST|nr:hypothetical protein KsCSTR_14080 [Candidatus Kuenenia stuttgartiensis]CAJ73756.1 unknown protein [Candidatus Kuenenia stuttgartiensis]
MCAYSNRQMLRLDTMRQNTDIIGVFQKTKVLVRQAKLVKASWLKSQHECYFWSHLSESV